MNPKIGLQLDYTTDACSVFASNGLIRSSNRVCNSSLPTDLEVETIKTFFGEVPFSWVVNAQDSESIKKLEQHNLRHIISFPAMIMDFNDKKMEEVTYNNNVVVKEIVLDNELEVQVWITVVVQAFAVSEVELSKLVNKLINKIIPGALKLYIAYCDEKPVAASMAIQHNDILSLHWVSTVPEFRNQGLGYAVTYKPLLDAQIRGCQKAILLSSVLGKSIYERLGFKEYALYNACVN